MTEKHKRILEQDGDITADVRVIKQNNLNSCCWIICVGYRDVIHDIYSCVLISVDQTIHWESSECFPIRWDPRPPPIHRNIPWVCLSRYPLLVEMKHICCPRKWNTWKSTVRPRAVCSGGERCSRHGAVLYITSPFSASEVNHINLRDFTNLKTELTQHVRSSANEFFNPRLS